MNEMDKYMSEIRRIVGQYHSIEILMNSLLEQANLLQQKKQEVEFKLAQTKEDEQILIDKIKSETGKDPNLLEIFQNINNQTQNNENLRLD